MRVVVTGASGKLGRVTCAALVARGDTVIGIDHAYADLPGVDLHVMPLDAPHRLYGLVKGADAVAHLGNYPNPEDPDFTRTYTSNVAANMNTFATASAVGVPRVIFASSIQVCTGRHRAEAGPSRLAYLPLDGDLPPIPGNPYAVGKAAGEQALKYFCVERGMTGIAIRFPYLYVDRDHHWITYRLTNPASPRFFIDEAESYLHIQDAASLIVACLTAPDLTGYRCYLPASPQPLAMESPGELRAKFYSDIPWRGDSAMDAPMVDTSRITREVGWEPTHILKAESPES